MLIRILVTAAMVSPVELAGVRCAVNATTELDSDKLSPGERNELERWNRAGLVQVAQVAAPPAPAPAPAPAPLPPAPAPPVAPPRPPGA